MVFKAQLLDGACESDHRFVVELEPCSDEIVCSDFVNAQPAMHGLQVKDFKKRRVTLKETHQRSARNYLDCWIQGMRTQRLHSWDATQDRGQYRNCWSVEVGRFRIGAYSFHPSFNNRIQIMVLVHVFLKATQDYPTQVKEGLVTLSTDPEIRNQVEKVVREKMSETKGGRCG